MRRGFSDGTFAISFGADLFGYIIRVLAKNGEYFIRKAVVLADLKEIFKPEHNVFSAPHIPSAEFFFSAVGRDSAEAVTGVHHITYRSFQNGVKSLVLRIGIGKASTAHHFSPVFNAPSEIAVVYVAYAELRNEQCP